MFKITNIAVILFITAAINTLASIIGWKRKTTRSGLYFALGMLGVTFWTLAAGFDYASVPITLKVSFAKLEYTSYNIAFVFFALFALSYAGFEDWLKKTTVMAFFLIVPISNILLAWTNDWHGWLWSGFTRSEFGDNTVIFEHGPGFLWTAVTGYMMILVIIVPLWRVSRRDSVFSRRQARLLFFAALIPILSNLFYLFQPAAFRGLDWSSITFSVSGLLFLWALYGMRLLDLMPIAREKLMSSLSDGMIVLDTHGRMIDINQPAARMIGSTPEKLIGKNVEEVVPLARSLSGQEPGQEARIELEFGSVDKRYFDLLVSPLFDDHKRIVGRIIIFRDITERKQIENDLRISEERFRELVMSAPDAVFGINGEGIIIFANHEASNLFGYENDELLGRDVAILVPPGLHDRYAGLRTGIITPYTRMMGSDLGLAARRKDGIDVPVEISLGHSMTETGRLVIAFMRDITDRKLAEQELSQARELLMEQHAELAKLEERQRLARDLHDSVTQSINGMVLFTDTLAAALEKNNNERARQIMERLQESARQSLKETRLLLYELQESGPERSMGLMDALEDRLAMVERRVGLRAQLIQEGSLEFCPPEWQENLFWIVVEALNNSLKHAQAHSVQIVIRCTPQQLEMEVSDNGIGFDPHEVVAGGLGLKNLRARADIIGGTLSIESEPLKGTTVRFCAEIRMA